MSPRAAWRLETLGFDRVYDYVGGKADWLAHALPREGELAFVPNAGDLTDQHPPTCRPTDPIAEVARVLDDSRDGCCLVINDARVVLGRVRRSVLAGADPAASAEDVMEDGPGTVRPSTDARELLQRLTSRGLTSTIVTTPEGVLIGTFNREGAETALARETPAGN